MASFAFVPRSVKGKAKAIESVVTANVASTSTAPSHVQLKQSKTPRLATVNADDVLALFSMALSSYSLFIEPATRRLLDRDEYVRLQALISSSPLLSHLPPGITEAQIVSALRQLPADTRPEMRIGQHGYEVHFPRHELQHRTHSSWESSTVYVENLPARERTLTGVHKALSDLLAELDAATPPSTSTSPIEPAIQHISFPPALNSRSQQERFRGFAFVVFRSEELACQFVQRWPWVVSHELRKPFMRDDEADEEDEDEDEEGGGIKMTKRKGLLPMIELAKQHGLRSLSKLHWLRLKADYLAEQRRLLELSRPKPGPTTTVSTAATSMTSQPPPPPHMKQLPTAPPKKRPFHQVQSASYPPGCLVFARSLPQQTNKTALKALFTAALEDGKAGGVDYVDWQKGMDTCYIRFSSAALAQQAIAYFQKPLDGDASSVRLELIEGERERIYWEKVPEHLRQQAVVRANGVGDAEGTTRKRRRAP